METYNLHCIKTYTNGIFFAITSILKKAWIVVISSYDLFTFFEFFQSTFQKQTRNNHTTHDAQKAEPVETLKDKPKAKKAAKSKYEELPEIPDYERPPLEKYDKSDFDPTKKVNYTLVLNFATFSFRALEF